MEQNDLALRYGSELRDKGVNQVQFTFVLEKAIGHVGKVLFREIKSISVTFPAVFFIRWRW